MKMMNYIATLISRNKFSKFGEVNSPMAVLLGVPSFLVSGYCGLFLSKFVPSLIDATNAHGFSALGIALWLAAGLLAFLVWVFGCIATRCHTVLYERWFK